MIKKIQSYYWLVIGSIVLSVPSGFLSAAGKGGTTATIPNPLGAGNDTITAFVMTLLDTIFPIAALISVFFIIFSGFLMVTAGANEEKLSKARQAFLWTVIGVAILLGAKVLSAVICGTVNQLLSDPAKLSCPTA